MEGQPQWVPERFEHGFFESYVALPMKLPQLFHPVFAPLPRVLGVHARVGVYAAEALARLCAEQGIPHDTYTVELGNGDALAYIKSRAQAVRETMGSAEGNSVSPPSEVLIVDRADLLIHNAETEQALQTACTELHQWCAGALLLILVLNCTRAERDPANTSGWLRHMRDTFYTQLSATVHFPAPDSAFRIRWFRWALEAFVVRHAGRTLALTDTDYVQLADMSTHATVANMLRWLQERVFTPMLFETIIADNGEITLDYLVERMPNTLGAKHVCSYDARATEAAYAESAMGAAAAAALPVPKEPRPQRVRLMQEEPQEGAPQEGGAQEGALQEGGAQEGGALKRARVEAE